MKNYICITAFGIILFVLLNVLTGCCGQSNQLKKSASETKRSAAMPAVLDKSKQYGRVIIAGQPNETEINGLTAMGITFVMNVRGYDEMNNRSLVHFDEDSLLRASGIPYKQMPVSGSAYPYRPALIDTLAHVLGTTKGIVLLHCTSGGRAAMVYAGYQVKYLYVSPLEAMRNLESYGMWPLPIEKLTGIPMRIEKADK